MPSRIRLVEGLQLPDVIFALEEELVHMGRGPLIVTLRQTGYGAWSGSMVAAEDESTQSLDAAEQAAHRRVTRLERNLRPSGRRL